MDKIDRLLLKVGMPPSNGGYRYTKAALMLLKEDPTYMEEAVKRLYPAIAANFETTVGAVERAIRHGIECAFDRMPPELMEEIFGNTIHFNRGKASNKELLACLLLHMSEGEIA